MSKLKTCHYCQKIHDSSIKCGGKRSYYREKNNRYTKDKDYLSFIKSKEWLNKSVEIKLLDNYNCLVCKSLGLVSPTYLEVHHIEKVRMNNDNRLENNNLITLCIHHHKQAENSTISSTELHNLIEKYRNKQDDKSDIQAL
ncbi:HNH endonuclease [Gemella sanguinis]|uniref:HNH endonuclease n=1 Tax=Gemella sanguinis TaxID=84135 RepID=UPI00352DE6F0